MQKRQYNGSYVTQEMFKPMVTLMKLRFKQAT